jgi:fatty acid desaturase
MVWAFVTFQPAQWLLPLLMLGAVPLLRALENLGGHEGGHGNWLRKRPRLNDWFANSLAAWWVVTSAQSFRKKHNEHHHHFGEAADPCFTRFSMFHFAQMKSWRKFLAALKSEYLPYLREYWQIYSPVKLSQILRTLLLHGTVMVIGSQFCAGFWRGWLLLVILPFLLILPVFRMLAESEEHNYDGRDELTDSHNNLGWFSRLYLHPAGDAYHKLHHVQPAIPHHRMRSVHLQLMDMVPEYRDSHAKQSPRS